MKNHLIILALLLFTNIRGFSQNVFTRDLPAFSKMIIRNNAKIHLTNGPQSVKLETEGDSSSVRTEVENSTLVITGQPAKIYISMPELTGVEISGAGSLVADSVIRTSSLRLDVSGNGKISMPVEVQKLRTGVSGMGKLNLRGHADEMEINISGNGKINGQDLKVNNADANISGVGKVYADVTGQLKLNISGTGAFYYKTEPASVQKNISGIGKTGTYGGEGDSTTMHVGNKKIIITGGNDNNDHDDDFDFDFEFEADTVVQKPTKSRSHWRGLDLGFNSLMAGDKFSTDLPAGQDHLELIPGKSINVNLNIWGHDFPIIQRYVMFTTGIGLTLNNYRFSSDQTLRGDTNLVVAGYDYKKDGDRISYQKNKLAVNYVTVPLLLQFNTHPELKKSFHIAAGVLLSYKYNSHLKLVYKDDGKQKDKRQDDFNIEPFRYDATVRLGYRNYTVFASYAMSELFKNERGPELHPFQFGISVVNW